ncbi:DNA-directed DNA polymerase [Methanobacterium alcaliphilum]|uniref:DNA-directed DNA polymerase n=1 Tax=Methanobacterium alcaliphilum TaxID=392018 RepID=UPI002009FAAE|nr:DNA-directed DNA polymerase [Methanobacterium alcaliphilum]MCK9151489.1 DNA-directed DNA polymerase [Methanobacterium alcaliphilum]
METKKMVLLDIDYVTEDDKAVIRLFGREKDHGNEKQIIALDRTFKPYIYVIPKDMDACMEQLDDFDFEKIEKVQKKDLGNEAVFLKVTLKHPQEVPKLRDSIRNLSEVEDIREHDIPFYRRYLIDKALFPMSEIELKGDLVNSSKCVAMAPEKVLLMDLDESPRNLDSGFPDLKILSFDIEVHNPDGMPNAEKDEIIMIGLSGNFGVEKVISTKGEHLDFVEKVETEEEMLQAFVDTIKTHSPDLIVGYNSDNFDFTYIKDRAKLLGIKLDLGLDGSELKFLRRGFANSAVIKGILHVDLYLVMRRYMHLDRYTLERVYLELFGEEKFDLPGDKLWQYWESDGEPLNELFKYSLDDVVTTYKIAEKILPLNLELTRLVGQPFFDLTRMATGQQAEWFLMRKAYEYGEVAPNKPSSSQFSQRKGKSVVGGYVKEPEIGLHENIVQFDFRSLYPSLIISKNISPDTLLPNSSPTLEEDMEIEIQYSEGDMEKYHIVPEYGYKFYKKPQGFIPSVIGYVLDERVRLKKKMYGSTDPMEKKIYGVQQDALKRLANTMYGVYGYSRFRWYSIECAEAITAWGRNYIKETMKKASKYGFHSIYADTDGFYATYKSKKDE